MLPLQNKRYNPENRLFDDSLKMLLNKIWISFTSEWFQLLYSSASAHKTFEYNWLHLLNFWNITPHFIYRASQIVFSIQVKTLKMITPWQDGQDYSLNGLLFSQSCEYLTINAFKDKTRAVLRSGHFLFQAVAPKFSNFFFQTLPNALHIIATQLCSLSLKFWTSPETTLSSLSTWELQRAFK